MKLDQRFRIVGVEVVGLGAFLLAILLLNLLETNWNPGVVSFGWVYAIIGVTLVLVGLETLSLIRHIPGEN